MSSWSSLPFMQDVVLLDEKLQKANGPTSSSGRPISSPLLMLSQNSVAAHSSLSLSPSVGVELPRMVEVAVNAMEEISSNAVVATGSASDERTIVRTVLSFVVKVNELLFNKISIPGGNSSMLSPFAIWKKLLAVLKRYSYVQFGSDVVVAVLNGLLLYIRHEFQVFLTEYDNIGTANYTQVQFESWKKSCECVNFIFARVLAMIKYQRPEIPTESLTESLMLLAGLRGYFVSCYSISQASSPWVAAAGGVLTQLEDAFAKAFLHETTDSSVEELCLMLESAVATRVDGDSICAGKHATLGLAGCIAQTVQVVISKLQSSQDTTLLEKLFSAFIHCLAVLCLNCNIYPTAAGDAILLKQIAVFAKSLHFVRRKETAIAIVVSPLCLLFSCSFA
jgi:hypothetical protein